MGSSLIQGLIVILLIAGIVAVVRIIQLVGDVQKTLAGVETTRADLSVTLKKIDSLADTTENMVKEELAPTLQVARQALANVEVVTNAVAETSKSVRDVTASVQNASKILTLGGPIAQALLSRVTGSAGGFMSGVMKGITMVLGRGAGSAAPKKAARSNKVVKPADGKTNAVLAADAKDGA
jgi:uncharacterized protein YoxC